MTCLLCGQDLAAGLSFSDWLCLRRPEPVCSTCWAGFEPIGPAACPTCCKPDVGKTCPDCLYWQDRGYSVKHLALYRYNASMKAYFSIYKFWGDYVLAQLFAKDLKKALRPYRGYVLVPVPVSPATYEDRQFNQVEGLLAAAGLPYQSLLTKGEGEKQSSKTRAERLVSCPDYQILPGKTMPKKIFLVDDIYTTGATIAGIIRLLTENGVEEVKTFSLAR